MNEIEKIAISRLPIVPTIDERRLLIRLMFSNGRICPAIASASENSLSGIEKTFSIMCSSDTSGPWNEATIWDMFNDEN